MDMQAIKDEIVLKLTGEVVSMELSGATLTKIVNKLTQKKEKEKEDRDRKGKIKA